MSQPPEHVIRDYLAGRLDLLEPELRLHQMEFPLPNSVGTRGYIDILARDQHGLWVIIEVKRDKKRSREAVTEVAKYVELLSREKHVANDRVRVIIAATDWAELLAPVSYAAREWSADLRGYQLAVSPDGTVSRADPVELIAPPTERFITPVHVIYFFDAAERRSQCWAPIQAAAAEVGAPDLLAAKFDRVANHEYVVAHHGLYIGIGKTDPAMIAEQIAGPCDEPEPFALDYPAEYQTLCHITHEVNSGTTSRSVVTIESAAPGDLYKIANDPGWQITGYVGAGVFGDTRIHDDEDCRRFLSGHDLGQGRIMFEGSANPRIDRRWASFCEQARASLRGNKDWDTLIPAWLDSAAQYPVDIDVWLKIFNPCDIVSAIVFGWPNRVLEYMPLIEGRISLRGDGEILLMGELCWDGKSGTNVPEHLGEVYRDPLQWFEARNEGMTWAYDPQILKRMGLRYILHETVLRPVPSESGILEPSEWTIWIMEDGKARRFTTKDPDEYIAVSTVLNRDGKIRSVPEYFAANPGQVDAAFRNYRYYLHTPPQPR